MCKPILLAGKDKVRKIGPKAVDEPFKFTGYAPWRAGWSGQKNDLSEPTQLLVQMFEPRVSY